VSGKAENIAAESRFSLFEYGFRPFFLLAGIYALVPTGTILWAITSGQWPGDALPLFVWHGHEMLFGFTAAAIAGFLLTAVPTWTGTRAVSGLPLIGLVLLWLAGRVVMSPWVPSSGLPAQAIGVAFLPALAVTVAIPLVQTRNFRNLPFLLLLAILFLGEILFHARYFNWVEGLTIDGLRLTINAVVLMIVIVGGRITPAFTRNTLTAMRRDVTIRTRPALDRAAIVSVVGVLIGDIVAMDSILAGWLAALSAGLLLFRLTGWGGRLTLDIPLLWVLHLGTLWLVFAFVMKALWLLGGFGWAMYWMHAFTAGVFGTMILGVMTRVALGHTGRPLKVSPVVVASYFLVSVAALTRVFGPGLAPNYYTSVLLVSITAWAAAFLIFLVAYVPILFRRRPDGRAG
jgi:uncharacterized protein involved in response to NO